MSREIKEEIKRKLLAESMGRCMNPACQKKLFTTNGNIIEKAHIVPYCKTADNSFENLVVLCPNCHTDFDKNDAFTSKEVLGWKAQRQKELDEYFSIKLNVAKIKEQFCEPNSLAEKITTENTNAQKYINYLLGDVICVENENELKRYERSITKTVMVYQNKAARQTKKEVYAIPYIGAESNRIRLQLIKNQIRSLEQELQTICLQKKQKDELRTKVDKSCYNSIINSKNVWMLCDQTRSKISLLKCQLSEIQKNTSTLFPKLDGYRVLKQGIEDKLNNSKNEEKSLLKEQTRVEGEEKAAEENIQQLEPLINELNGNLSLTKKVEDFSKVSSMSIKDVEENIKTKEKEINKININLPYMLGVYIERFDFDATNDIDSLNIFYQEYNQVVTRNLTQHMDKLQEVKQEAVLAFQNAYIAEIRKHIRDEKRNIEQLNKVLANKPFGTDGEIYQFKIDRSQDKVFGDYYDVFMSNEDYQANDLFTSQLTNKNYNLMQDLFAQLTKEDVDEKYIKDYTDYRKFMSYDIKITNKRNEVSYLSKINKGKSGGETQTPFYVIMAASFEQLMQESYGRKSPGCIIMFDEAFNNMDESHIASMMQYLLSLNIQPIIVVPTQRAKIIMPYVLTTIAVVKKENRMLPKTYIKYSYEL